MKGGEDSIELDNKFLCYERLKMLKMFWMEWNVWPFIFDFIVLANKNNEKFFNVNDLNHF